MPEELVRVPDDLRLLSDDELAELKQQVIARFNVIHENDDVSPEEMDEAERLAVGLDRIRVEESAREVRATETEKSEKAALAQRRAELAERVHGPGSSNGEDGQVLEGGGVDIDEVVAAASRGTVEALVQVLGDKAAGKDLVASARRPASLSEARRHQPTENKPRQRLQVTASVEIPGVAKDTPISDIDALVDIVQRKSKSMPVSHQQPNQVLVASMRNEYEHTIDDRTKPGQVEELFRHLTAGGRAESADALVAAGGWCAPSEIRYEFFSVAATSGLIDLPTFGVSRGGVQFPTSPSLADTFDGAFGGFSQAFSNTSNPWLWTESDDVDAETNPSTIKQCVRVPCPDFNDRRLECYGLCVTAGNLTDDAYPEATRNFLQLMMVAHERARNGRIISQMQTLSGSALNTGLYADSAAPAFNQIFGGVALGAADYRARFGMDHEAVLEAILPYWVLEVIRADVAYRTGIEPSQVADAEITSQFTSINIRPQFVNDWQVRGAGEFGEATPIDDWPVSANVMIYAAGTFMLGNGLSLDLGVVRDSALNETNDHTAAWSEECHLVAQFGHESRQYQINFSVSGRTGAADVGATS